MVAPPTERPPTQVPAARARSSWNSRLQGLSLAAALMALDLLPLYALLLVAAGLVIGDIGRPALPFSFLAAAMAVFALLGHTLYRLPITASIVPGVVVGAGALAVALAISPAGYGDSAGDLLGGSWPSALANELSGRGLHFDTVLALGLLILFLGWRGITLGREPPDMDSVLTLFKISLGVLIFAAILSSGVKPAQRLPAEAALGFMLPLAVFAGLLASALSRAALNREELQGADPRASGGERWLGMAIVLSGLVVLIALIISAIVTYGSISAAMTQLGPVGEAIDTVVSFVILGLALLLFFLLTPLLDWLQTNAGQRPLPTPTQTQQPAAPPTSSVAPHSLLSDQWLHIAQALLFICTALLAALIAVAILRALTGARRQQTGDGVEEEREALDGASLLQAQLRGFLDRFGHRPAPADEQVAAGSVRALYRELLQAAASRGIGRRAQETPDEYGRRLGATLGVAAPPADVATISETYDEARYGAREPAEGARRALRDQARRVLQAIRRVG